MNLHHTVWIPNRIQDKEWSKCTKNNENLKIDFESEKEYFKDTMTNEMDVNRVVTEYAKVLFETNGKPIKCNTHYYLGSGGEKIVFL